jgi:hypothetical protein
MTEFEHAGAGGEAAVAAYRRTLLEVAGRQVVDEAEDVLARVWIGHLDEMRRAALSVIASAHVADSAARTELRQAQERGRPDEMARAHARMQSTRGSQECNLRDARAFIASVEAELELVCQAGVERVRRDRADHSLLDSARRAAYGEDVVVDPGD